MDLSSIMPLINMLSQSMQNNNNQSQSVSATPLSAEDQEYINKNTSMFPKPFATTNNSSSNNSTSASTQSAPKPPQQNGAPMDLNKVLPLINSMAGNQVDTGQISKLMSGLNGGGDLGSIINLMSNFAKSNHKPSSKNTSQIINSKNDHYIKA